MDRIELWTEMGFVSANTLAGTHHQLEFSFLTFCLLIITDQNGNIYMRLQVWFQNRRSKERRLKHLCNYLRRFEQCGFIPPSFSLDSNGAGFIDRQPDEQLRLRLNSEMMKLATWQIWYWATTYRGEKKFQICFLEEALNFGTLIPLFLPAPWLQNKIRVK